MNQVTAPADVETAIPAPFFVRGKLVDAREVVHRSRDLGASFVSPKLNLDEVITPRTEPGPLFDVPLAEIIDFLVETGQRMHIDRNPHLAECAERMAQTNVMTPELVKNSLSYFGNYLDKTKLHEIVEQNFGNPKVLDEWTPRVDSQGRKSWTRAFPPRLIHVLPGNSPSAAVQSVALGAMCKAINLFKMGSSDPFMAVAFLRTMLDVDADHPVPKSMSAVYWRGGDEATERTIFRPQYFDRIVAWGGGDAINNVIKYLMPGLQLVSFDPKTSISMVGREAHESDATIEEAARGIAHDVGILNQEACVSSRFTFVEGTREQVDKLAERVLHQLHEFGKVIGKAPPLPRDLVEEVETLQMVGGEYRVWGKADGSGMVIRSEEPVDFHPVSKTANLVMVPSLKDALKYVNVATQTVGIYPPARQVELRDGLASGGAQMIVRLGEAGASSVGAPHDAMYPMARFIHWIVHEDGFAGK
jgi:hypothetical protein